jgi:hypothetical protein
VHDDAFAADKDGWLLNGRVGRIVGARRGYFTVAFDPAESENLELPSSVALTADKFDVDISHLND